MDNPLQYLNLGNSVAEFDAALEDYFVETAVFRDFVQDKADIIAGDKGTGKSALFKKLAKDYRSIGALKNVELLAAFNVTGNPVFQRLTEQQPPLSEGQYITVWKSYFISLAGNWALQFYERSQTEESKALGQLLDATGLRAKDDQPSTIFGAVASLARRLLTPKSFAVEVGLNEQGLPIIVPRVELGDLEVDHESHCVRHESALRLLESVLRGLDVECWIALDRLDEAFQGHPATELPALRALFRAYLDLQAFRNLRLKIFVRSDLFRRITRGGFVNLSHVNARRLDIVWNDDDLYALLMSRISKNANFLQQCGLAGKPADEAFAFLFPRQVETGEKQRDTWSWMISRIQDANYVKPPRNLIDLVNKTREAQLRKSGVSVESISAPLCDAESIKRGQEAMSNARVEDTLLAETGNLADMIAKFRDKKAEHNEASVSALLGTDVDETRRVIKGLMEAGFFEQVGESFKVPMLYRAGLNISQGKAF